MAENQDWHACKYAIGNLDIDTSIPKVKLLKAIFPEKEEDKLLRENGISKVYYCKCPELIKLEAYMHDGLPITNDKSMPVAQLFYLDISGNYEGPHSLDLFGSERYYLEDMIKNGLKMCRHCKFYEGKENENNLH